MISTEVLIVMLVFLVYVGIWMSYMDSFMGTVQNAMHNLEYRSIADAIVHKANIACVSSGEETIDFGKNIELRISGNTVSVNGIERDSECEFSENYGLNASKIAIKKENGLIVVKPA